MKNGEKQVYPLQDVRGTILQTGLTKREYFAGLAMQGFLANQRLSATEQNVAKASVILADELLKQLENETTKQRTTR